MMCSLSLNSRSAVCPLRTAGFCFALRSRRDWGRGGNDRYVFMCTLREGDA